MTNQESLQNTSAFSQLKDLRYSHSFLSNRREADVYWASSFHRLRGNSGGPTERLHRFCSEQKGSTLSEDYCYVPFYFKPISWNHWKKDKYDLNQEYCVPIQDANPGFDAFFAKLEKKDKYATFLDDFNIVNRRKDRINGILCAISDNCDHLPEPLVNIDTHDKTPDNLKGFCEGPEFLIQGNTCYYVDTPKPDDFEKDNCAKCNQRQSILKATCQKGFHLDLLGLASDYAFVDANIQLKLDRKGLLKDHNYYWVQQGPDGTNELITGLNKEKYPKIICQYWSTLECDADVEECGKLGGSDEGEHRSKNKIKHGHGKHGRGHGHRPKGFHDHDHHHDHHDHWGHGHGHDDDHGHNHGHGHDDDHDHDHDHDHSHKDTCVVIPRRGKGHEHRKRPYQCKRDSLDCRNRPCNKRTTKAFTRTTTTRRTPITTPTTLPPTTTEDIVITHKKWIKDYVKDQVTPLYRSYSWIGMKHGYHVDWNYFQKNYINRGYEKEYNMGKVLDMKTYNTYKRYIDAACPELRIIDDCQETYTLSSSNYNQFFKETGHCGSNYTSYGQLMVVAPRKGYCGATEPMHYFESRALKDSFYTFSDNERDMVLKNNGWYKNDYRGIVFYVWE
ncbi:hypothetical protein L596_030316 [Steinernema carpocapsae]|uniref:Uncharacterized protein n=2 Tax=Steinernema carpocapsae TaxID=34508 RepID=A0A4U5LP15_STECR|nr:hypothetical protein L596_030316 [Steinernema carpocapsae]